MPNQRYFFRYGVVPLDGTPNKGLWNALKTGARCDRPEGTADGLWDILMLCWEFERYSRPTFGALIGFLERYALNVELEDVRDVGELVSKTPEKPKA